VTDHFWLCLHLDERGRPCNRRTMHADIEERLCDQHREKPQRTASAPSTAEYQRDRRARLARAGLSPAMEAA
jgi:hypothetical protein